MGLRLMGSVTGVASWVMIGDTLWSGGTGVWYEGLGPGSGARGQGEGHRSRVRVWCKGLDVASGSRVRSGVWGWD